MEHAAGVERNLRNLMASVAPVLDAVSSPVFIKEPGGRCVGCNAAFAAFVGCSTDQIVGRHASEFSWSVVPDFYDACDSELLLSGEAQVHEGPVPVTDGSVRHIEMRKTLLPRPAGAAPVIVGTIIDITERKRADEALRREQEFTETAINVMPGTFFVLSRDMRYVRWNRSQEARVGQPLEQMRDVSALSLIQQDDRAEVVRAVQRAFETGSGQCEARGVHNGTGDLRHFLYNARRMEIGGAAYLVCTGIDITERKRAEAALAASEARYRLIATNTSDGIFTLNREGCITFVSPHWLRKGGYREDEVVGHGMMEFVPPEFHSVVLSNFRRSMAGEATPNYEIELLMSDGVRLPVELSMSNVLDGGGHVVGRVGVFRDITERKQAEATLKRSLESLRTAMAGIVQAMVMAVEARDPYTAGHQRRVARLATAIAAEMGLEADVIEGLRYASVIHDIGKISLPAEILSKPMRLTNLEVRLVQTHPQAGYDILKDIEFPWPIATVILQHHERIDGSGYPAGLKGDDIRIEARILGVADVVDAVASHRPYRPALGIEAALVELEAQKGVLYDRAVVGACHRLFRERAFTLAD